MNEISWADTLAFGSDLKSRGHYEGGSFVIRFVPTATGRSISLRHNDEFVQMFKTVGAAKRRARQIAKTLTIRSTEIETISRDVVNVGGHEVSATWDANGARVDHSQLRAIRDAGNANWSDEEISGIAYSIEVRLDETYTKAYRIAVAEGDGWHELDAIRAVDDDAANAYAEQHYADQEWYVLDATGQNVNG